MAGGLDSLRELLERLRDLAATDADRDDVDELIRRCEHRALRVVVAGEAKRGKSTVINALLDQPVLPTGVVPLTAIATTVVHGDEPKAEVRFLDGSVRSVAVGEIADYVAENHNPHNALGVSEVVVTVSSELLATGAELVDTPGTGSVYRHNTDEAVAAYRRMDAAVFVLTADPPISHSERDLVHTIGTSAATTWFLLNKVDRLASDDVDAAVDFTRRVLEELVGAPVEVWPVCALRPAEATKPHGIDRFDEFASAFRAYVSSGSSRDLTQSLTTRGARIAQAIEERTQASLAAASIADRSQIEALANFADCLREVEAGRRSTRTHLDGAIRMLISDTDESAQELLQQTQAELTAQLRAFLDTTGQTPRHAESEGVSLATALIRGEVERWRTAWREHLDARLASLETELADRLERQVATVRDTASELFGVTFAEYAVERLLLDHDRFTFQFQTPPGQYDTMAATLRRVLPARVTRQWVARYVLARASALLDQQVGRARSHFQRALSETARDIQAALERQYEGGAGDLVAAIETGTMLRESGRADVSAELDVLRRRSHDAGVLRAILSPPD